MSLDASCTDGRISTEWFLDPRYEEGVTSTTRYRKGNNRVAGGPSRGGGRVAAGRKGGYQAAQNRKKGKAEKHHHQAAARKQQQGRHGSQLHQQPHYRMQELAAPQYYPGEYYAHYAAAQQQQHQQPPPGQPMSSSTTSPYQVGYGVPGVRGSLMPASEDPYLGRSRALQSDNDHISGPSTPPGSDTDSPVEDLLFGDKQPRAPLPPQQQQQQASYMRDVATASAGFGSYQPLAPAGGAGYAQQGYTMADAVAYEPRPGHEAPLFTDRLTAEDAALFAPSNPGWDASGAYFG